jgi:plastocyanin
MRKALLLALLAASCDGGGGPPGPPMPPPPAIDPATAGTVKGKVVFKGTPPANPKLPVGGNPECAVLHSGAVYDEIVLVGKDGGLRNAFVHVKSGLESLKFPWPGTPSVVANEKCVYRPRVSGVRVNQPIKFTNEDPADHNVHGFSSQGQFNFTLRGRGTSGDVTLRRPEIMLSVKCDIHPWMIGYVGAVAHPFFQVTAEDGAFEFKGLPPGEYTVEVWHEKYGTKTATATLEAGGTVPLEFSYAP